MSTRYVGENDSLDTLWVLKEIDAWAEPGEGGRGTTRSPSRGSARTPTT